MKIGEDESGNPPFNVSDWGGERLQDDVRWKYGIPPVGNANFAWLQHMFYSTGIPVSLWILRKGKTEQSQNKVLFIDARKLGHMIDRKVRELSEDDIRKIADIYQNWRQGKEYEDIQGFCKEASLDDIRDQDYILTPGRYVGIEHEEDDGEAFGDKMQRLTSELSQMFKESNELQEEIKKKLGAIGYEI